jgi:hypothetical protein
LFLPIYPKITLVAGAFGVTVSAVMKMEEEKTVRTNLSKLTEETIKKKTQAGDTPLHRAAKIGRIFEIPDNLLSIELFTAKNNNGDTPLHLAARFGVLNQIPRQFLTKETLTMRTSPPRAPNGVYFTGSGYEALTPTVLHDAASSGHADQIPKEFLTPEFLFIEATGHQQTVLEHIIKSERLDVLPKDFSNSELWNLKDSKGQTPRRIFEMLMEREAQLAAWRVEDQSGQSYVSRVRSEPATEKQKEKLRYFGYTFDETILKGQASDALDKCARDFPEVEQTYYNRPATKEQLAKLHEINDHPDCGPDEPFYDFENEGPLTYEKAKDLIQEWGGLQRTKEREKEAEELEKMYAMDVDLWSDIYRGLTWDRVQTAAQAFDKSQPGWRQEKNNREVVFAKVAELNPQLAERWGRAGLKF